MNESPFQAFIDLVSFDQETISLEKNIQKIEKNIEGLQEQLKKLEADTQNAKYSLHDAKKEVDVRELEMKDFEQQEAERRKRLDAVSNNKEYMSIKHEIEKLQAAQHEHEDVLIAAWNNLETAKQEYGIKETSFEKKSAELHDEIQKKEQELAQLKINLEHHNQQRTEKEKQVKPEYLEKYSMMRSRVANPVVPVEQDSCSACFYNVTKQDLLQLRNNKMLQCKGCYRFLYIKSAEE